MALTKAQITYRLRHPEKIREYERSDRARASGRRWYQANREKILARVKAYRDTNPEYRKRKQELERGLRSSNVYRHIIWDLLRQRDGDICQICNLPIAPGEESIDHILPLSMGGSHSAENVRLLHRTCNVRRPKGRFKKLLDTKLSGG